MALDTSIYSALQPGPAIQQQNPLAMLAGMAQLQAAQREARAFDQEQAQKQGLNDAYKASLGADGAIDRNKLFSSVASSGYGSALPGIQKNFAEVDEKAASLQKTQLETSIKRNEALSGVLLQASNNPAAAQSLLQEAVDNKFASPDWVQKVMQGAASAQNPGEFFKQGAMKAISAKDQMAQQLEAQKFQETQIHNRNTEATAGRQASAAETRANAAVSANAATRTASGMNAEMKLADDYRAQAKPFKEVADAYRTITSTLDQATTSPAATLAAATKFMKLLDPGSVVRESELGMALAASGVIDRATNYINVLQSGKVLTPTQVKDFKNITEQIYQASQQGQQRLDADYTQKAQGWGLNPASIVQNLGQSDPAKPKPGGKGKSAAAALSAGTVVDGYRFKGGNPNDPSSWEKQ